MVEKKIDKKSIVKVVIAFLAIVSGIVVFVNFGKNLVPPLKFFSEFDSPELAVSNSKPGVCVEDSQIVTLDQQGHRLTIMGPDKKVSNQLMFDDDNKYLVKTNLVRIYGDYIYVLGYVYLDDDGDPLLQRLIKLNMNGDFIEVLYEQECSAYNFDANWIFDVEISNDVVYLTRFDNTTVFIDRLIDKESHSSNEMFVTHNIENIRQFAPKEYLISIYYRVEDDCCIMLNILGEYIINYPQTQVPFTHQEFSDFVDTLNTANSKIEFVYKQDASQGRYIDVIYKNKDSDTEYSVKSDYDSLFINYVNTNFIYADELNNKLLICDYNHDEIQEVSNISYSWGFVLINLLIWMAIVYLIIVVFVFAIRALIKVYRRNVKGFYRIVIGTVIFASMLGTAVYFSSNLYDKSKEESKQCLNIEATYFSRTSYDIGDIIQEENWIENLSQYTNYPDAINKLQQIRYRFEVLVNEASLSNYSLFYRIYKYDRNNNNMQLISDKRGDDPIGTIDNRFSDEVINNLKNGENHIDEYKNFRNKYLYADAPIYNSNKDFVGCIQIGCYTHILESQSINWCINLIVVLILLLIFLYMIINQSMQIRHGVNLFKFYKKNKMAFPEINLVGTIDFAKYLIFNADCVLGVLISKGMLEQYGLQNDGVMIGIPTMMVGVGFLIGPFLFSFLNKYFSIRKQYIIGCLGVLASVIFIIISIDINSFYIYSVAKLFFGTFYSVIDVADNTYPLFLNDKKSRYSLIKKISLTDMATSVLSVLIAGQLANAFGPQAIYVFMGVVAVVILFASFFVFPNDKRFEIKHKSKDKSSSLKEVIKLCITPSMIMSVLLVVVIFLANGYKSYMFPLYIDGMNIPQSSISNMFVICAAIAYILSDAYERSCNRYDSWTIAMIDLIALSVIFCVFGLNSTVIWALIAIVLVSLVQRSLSSQRQKLWPRKCLEVGIQPGVLQRYFSVIEGLASITRPLLLGLFLNIGGNHACLLLGIVLALFTAIYFFVTKNSALKNNVDW